MANYPDYGYQDIIWKTLYGYLGNEIGAAAFMGNMWGESNLVPYRKQGDYTAGFAPSIAYTDAIDKGTYTKSQFMNDGIGYGLAQWTYYTRKQHMYEYWLNFKSDELSIGDITFELYWFMRELDTDYPWIKTAMQNATDLDAASDYVLRNYENPEGIPALIQPRRNATHYFYNKYTGGIPPEPPTPPPEPPTPPGPGPGPTPAKVGKMKIMYYLRRKF